MRFDRPGDVFLADCPARLTLELIADKWSLVILHALGVRNWRHGELRKLIGGISSKVLTQTLRRLERHGLVFRHEYAEVPRRVEYELSDLGRTLLVPIDALTEWAQTHGAAIMDAVEPTNEAGVRDLRPKDAPRSAAPRSGQLRNASVIA